MTNEARGAIAIAVWFGILLVLVGALYVWSNQ